MVHCTFSSYRKVVIESDLKTFDISVSSSPSSPLLLVTVEPRYLNLFESVPGPLSVHLSQ